jgi:hypothetical protein
MIVMAAAGMKGMRKGDALDTGSFTGTWEKTFIVRLRSGS